MCVNQMAVVQPRLIPSQLPCGLKYSSSNSGTPILSLWANKSGISSTRSVVTFTCSVMPTAYRICKILSLFGRTMSLDVEQSHKAKFPLSHSLIQILTRELQDSPHTIQLVLLGLYLFLFTLENISYSKCRFIVHFIINGLFRISKNYQS